MLDFANIKNLAKDRPLAIILAGGLGGLAITRSLGKHGVPVIVLGRDKYLIKSNYCQGYLIRKDSDILSFLKELPKYIDKKALIFCDNERGLRLLYDNWNWLGERYLAPFSEINSCLTNKVLLPQAAENAGLKVPKIYFKLEDITKYPVLVKPRHEEAHIQRNISKAYQCNNEGELIKCLALLESLKVETYLQEVIPGKMDDLYSVTLYRSATGQVHVGYGLRKVRQYPQDYGTGTCQITWEEPRVIEYSIRLLESVGYIGVAEIEYKYCKDNDDFFIIEVNGRFPLHISLAEKAGHDFLFTIYQDLVSEQYEGLTYIDRYKKPVIWTFFLKDVLTTKGRLGLIFEYLGYLRKATIQGAIWDKSDLKPQLYFINYLLGKAFS